MEENFETSSKKILENVLCSKNFSTIFFSQGPFLHPIAHTNFSTIIFLHGPFLHRIAHTLSLRLHRKFNYSFSKIFLK